MWPAVIAAGAGIIGGIWSNAANAREARRNREFQERMSSSAHQREVADLRRAGINPMMRGMGGSSTPSGDRAEVRDPVGPAVSSAVMMRAQLGLVKAQTEREFASAMLTQQQRLDLQGNPTSMGRPARTIQELRELDLAQRREQFPLLLQKARAEIQATVSSAHAAEARTVLDKAAAEGAGNIADFERRIGEAGPAVRFFYELLRMMRAAEGSKR